MNGPRPIPEIRPWKALGGGLARPRPAACAVAGLLVWLAASAGALGVEGEAGPPSASNPEPIRFRRVFAPADRLQDWPRDAARYVPMPRDEFETLVRQAAQAADRSQAATPQTPASARYSARLLGDSLVDGEAVYDVAAPPAAPSTVWLAPCNLALSEAVWLGQPPQPAELATGNDGRIGVRAAGPGQLRVKWSLRALRDSRRPSPTSPSLLDGLERPALGGIEFLLELPACPINQLALVLPRHLAPRVDGAIVSCAGSASEATDRWRIELGGRNRFRLRLAVRDDAPSDSPRTTLTESVSYELSLRGLELSAQWTLDVPAAGPRHLAVDLDPSLQLVSARSGGQPVPWSVVGSADAGKPARVVLELPESFQGTRRMLRLGAVAPTVLGQRWRLPRIRPLGVFWQEASAALLVLSPMALADVNVREGRQVQTGPLPSPQSGQMAEFQWFSPDAAIDVVLVQAESPPEFDCGVALELSGVDMAAEVAAKFRLAQGQRFQIDATVSSRWTVDAVETVPAGALEDWSVVRVGPEFTAKDKEGAVEGRGPEAERPSNALAPKARLTIRLAKSLSSQRPLKVIVQARHHYSPLGRTLGREDVVPIEFCGASGGRRLVSIRAAEGYRLRWTEPERLTRVEPKDLAPGELDLFDAPPEGLVFVDDVPAASLAVNLVPQTPSYSAAIHVEAEAADTYVRESYAIRCVPEGAKVDRLLVQFSQPRDIPPRWDFPAEDGDPPTVRPWQPAASPNGVPAARGDAYEIVFHRPRRQPFEIRAWRAVPFEVPVSIAFAALPEAIRQEGTVSVRAAASLAVGIAPRQLPPVPPESIPADHYSTVRSVYRYDPARDVLPASETALVLTPDRARPSTPWAWAWSCDVESRFESGGASHHLVEYRIQNSGRQRLLVGLPEGVELDAVRGVWVDGQRVPRETACERPVWISVALPAEHKFPVISVLLSVKGSPLGLQDSVMPVAPELDVPILHRSWTAWLPPGYEPLFPRNHEAQGWSGELSVAQRLLGPLGRPGRAGRFRPWTAEAWTTRETSWTAAAAARRFGENLLARLVANEPAASDRARGEATSAPGGRWVERLGRAAADLGRTLLIDQRALARAGGGPPCPGPPLDGETAADRGEAILEQAGLCLLVADDAVLLTTISALPRYRGSAAAVGVDGVWRVLPSPLAERLAAAVQSGRDAAFVPWEAWRRESPAASEPWTRRLPTFHAPTEASRWSAYGVEWPADRDPALPIVHGETFRAMGWSVFVGVLGLLFWLGRPTPGVQDPRRLEQPAGDATPPDSEGVAPPQRAERSGVRGLLARSGTATAAWVAGWSAAAVALLPDALAPLAAGVLWAALAWLGLRWFFRRNQALKPGSDPVAARRQAALSEATRLALAGAAAAWGLAWGTATAEPPAPASAETVHQVLIPVDEKQQPTGGKYYVPEPLFRELQAAASRRSDDGRGWTLSSAVYRGILSWQSALEQFVMEEIRASFDLHVLARQVRVRLPLGRTGVEALPGGIALEGRSLQPTWPDAEGNLAFDVAEPGRYRLEVAVRPIPRSAAGRSLVDWRIPALAASRFELTLPPDAPPVEFPSAQGEIVREPDPSRFVVALGPTDRLQAAWGESGPRSVERSVVDVEQLLWLKVRPDAVVVEAVFQFRILEGRLREVELALDPRLRYFTPADGRPAVAQATRDLAEAGTLRLQLAEEASGKLAVPATFLLEGSSGVGRHRLPLIEVLNARTTRRWLALSVDPALDHAQSPGRDASPISTSSFVAAWGGAKSGPLAAWELFSPHPDFSVATRPVPSRLAAQQRLTLSFAAQSVGVALDAELTISGDAVFQLRVAAPPQLEIERVSVREGGVERVARHARGADGSAVVFLNGPTRGKQQFTLQGRLETPRQGALALPFVRLLAEPPDRPTQNGSRRPPGPDAAQVSETAASGASSMEIRLVRDPAVRVTVLDSSGLNPVEPPPTDEALPAATRLVQAFRVASFDRAAARVAIAPNRPKVRAEQITRMRKSPEAWQADVEWRFTVRDGLVDQFVFDVPAGWAGPFVTQPFATVQAIEAPGSQGRQLVVRPRLPVEGDFRLRVTSPLRLRPNDPPSLPKIVPDAVTVTRHRVILPRVPGGTWQTRGLIPTDVTADVAILPAEDAPVAAYQAVGEDFQATLREDGPGKPLPEVHLASLRVAWQADGSFWAVASYDLDPAGLDACPMVLPPQCRLVQALVGGQPVLVSPEASRQTSAAAPNDSPNAATASGSTAIGPTRWLVPLASATLPQRIELVWIGEGEPPAGSGTRAFAWPTPGEIPVRQCLWTVAAPGTQRIRAGEPGQRQTALQHALVELRNLASALQRAVEAASHDRDALARWHRDWVEHWLAARARAERQWARSEASPETAAWREEIESLDRQQAAIADRLKLSAGTAPAPSEGEARLELPALWLAVESSRGAAMAWGTAPAAGAIVIDYDSPAGSSALGRFVAAVGFAVAGMAVAWGCRRGWLQRWLVERRAELGVAIGLAWWWWLAPSALGLAIAVACAAMALWSWRRQRRLAAQGHHRPG